MPGLLFIAQARVVGRENGFYLVIHRETLSLLGLPVERQRRLAKGKAVEMARDGALEGLELAGRTRRQAAVESVCVRLQRQGRIAWPVGAPRSARKSHRPCGLVEGDGEGVAPVLAK